MRSSAFPLGLSLALFGLGCAPTPADRIRVQCHEARANLEAFCSPDCRMAYVMTGSSCTTPDVPPSVFTCLNMREQEMLCTTSAGFYDCDLFADCLAAESAEVQQAVFDSEGCFRAATAPFCE